MRISVGIGCIVKAMLNSPIGLTLVFFQLAVTVALLSNALLIIDDRVKKIARPVGAVDTMYFSRILPLNKEVNLQKVVEEGLDAIRGSSGVLFASSSYGIPLSSDGFSSWYWSSVKGKGESVVANYFGVDEYGVRALGAKLLQGRDFNARDVYRGADNEPKGGRDVLITRQLASALFDDLNPVGLSFFESEGYPLKVIGVVDHLLTWPDGAASGNTILFADGKPMIFRYILIRTEKHMTSEGVVELVDKVFSGNEELVVTPPVSMADKKTSVYSHDVGLLKFLSAMSTILLLLCAFSVMSLMAYVSEKRRSSFAVQVALGATDKNIFNQVLVEVFLLSFLSSMMGSGICLFIGFYFGGYFIANGLPILSVVISSVCICTISVVATIPPASRAAKVRPSEMFRGQ